MDYQSLLFIGFVVLNTVFSYKAGKNEGLFQGMISITQFYKDKSALKDKQSILGFENWPDPATNPDGSVDLSGGGAVGLGPSSAVTLESDEVRAAIPVCGPLIAGASFLPNNGQGVSIEAQDQLVNFAQCLRDEGIDVSDPDLSGGATGLLDWDFDPGDPANADAMEACQTLFAGGSGG